MWPTALRLNPVWFNRPWWGAQTSQLFLNSSSGHFEAKKFSGVPVYRRTSTPGKIEILKTFLHPYEWYLVGKFRVNVTLWWKNYKNWKIFGRVMARWSWPGIMTSSFAGRRCRRRRWGYPNIWPPIVFIFVRRLCIPKFRFIPCLIREL